MGGHVEAPARRDRLILVFAAAGVVIAALAVLGESSTMANLLGAPTLALLATAALAVGIVRWRPESARAWWWVCGGFAFIFLAELTTWIYTQLSSAAFPSMADAFHLASYPAVAAGLVTLAAAHTAVKDRSAVLDAWIVAVAAALVLWLVLMTASPGDSGMTSLQRGFSTAYLGGDVLLLALVVRLLFALRTRTPAMMLIFASIATMLVGDVLYAIDDQRLDPSSSGSARAFILAAFVLAGLAGLHHSIGDHVEPAAVDVTLKKNRLVLLILAAMLPPTLGITHELGLWDVPDAIIVISLGTIAVSTLVLVRMWGLTRVERAGIEERGRNRFEQMIRHSKDVVTVVQPDGRLDYASPASAALWGFDPEERLGTDLSVLVPSAEVSQLREHLMLAAALPSGATNDFDVQLRRRDGVVRHMEVVATNLLDDPEIHGLVLTFHDATDQKTLERELAYQAFHDSLTGLANRALFFDRVEHALVRHKRSTEGQVAVLFIDLDDFKSVNDGLGHGYGDKLLIAVGERLQQCLRPGDTAARLGGDEFAILLEEQADLEKATVVAQRLLEVLQLPASVGELEITVPASIGIALAEAESTPQDLMRDADIAMYAAKANGKGRYEVFDRTMRERASRRLEFRAELAGALDRDELVLDYQPIIDVSSGMIVSVEALLRWHHPTRGVIPPLDFIPYAEESGLILSIGRWVIDTACEAAAAWQEDAGRPIAVAVNISAAQLVDPELVSHVRAALEHSGLKPESLVLELTESILMEDTQHTIRVLEKLKEIGVRISVDDFGTGYSSLAYLRRFPVDDVKIDRTFIEELGQVPTSGSLASSIMVLADGLGVSAVAEGVERSEQLEVLKQLRCDYAQGFLLSRPVSAKSISTMLREREPVRVGSATKPAA